MQPRSRKPPSVSSGRSRRGTRNRRGQPLRLRAAPRGPQHGPSHRRRAIREQQKERLAEPQGRRDRRQWRGPRQPEVARRRAGNLLYPMKEALASLATLGEVSDTLRGGLRGVQALVSTRHAVPPANPEGPEAVRPRSFLLGRSTGQGVRGRMVRLLEQEGCLSAFPDLDSRRPLSRGRLANVVDWFSGSVPGQIPRGERT